MLKSPCAKDCPDRKAGCHNESCPHGWAEYEKANLNRLAEKPEKAEQKYDRVRTAAYFSQQIKNIKHLQSKARRGR